MEAKILATLGRSRKAYEHVQPFLREGDLSERGFRIYTEIDQFYQRDLSAKEVDFDVVLSRLRRALPTKLADQFASTIDTIRALEVSPENIAHEFLELRRDAVGHRLASALQGGSAEQLFEAHQEYGRLLEATAVGDAAEVDIDLHELFAERLAEGSRHPLLPGVLNTALGGLRPGDTVLIFGRPNAGKSGFVINASTGFIRRGLRVLFIENEDSQERTLSRFVRRLIERDEQWCLSNPAEAKERAVSAGRGLLHLYKLTPGTPKEIEALVRRIKPDVLVVNQLRAMAHAMPGKLTPNLEKIALDIRNIGQRHNLMTIMVTQANANQKDKDGNVVDKPVLYMEDIDSSLTGLPGACDFIIGYGTSRQLRQNKMACLSVCKSKGGGDGEHFYVGVDPTIDKLLSRGY